MRAKNVGAVLFWLAVVYMAGLGFAASWWVRAAYRFTTLEQAGNTIWRWDGLPFGLWSSSIQVGVILAGAGILLYARPKGWRVWLLGLAMLALLALDTLSTVGVLPELTHVSAVFGVGGGLILVFFAGIVWCWAKKYQSLADEDRTAAEYQLIGYLFLMIGMWYLCGSLSWSYMQALREVPARTPISGMVYLTLGWLFLFLGNYSSAKRAQG